MIETAKLEKSVKKSSKNIEKINAGAAKKNTCLLSLVSCPLKKILLILVCSLAAVGMQAQQQGEVFYRLELGAGLGVGFGLNDVNSKFYGKSNLAGALVARHPLNPRMALKAIVNYQRVSGTADVEDFYPATLEAPTSDRLQFEADGNIVDLCAMYELHFLPYGWLQGYQGYKRITPYIQFGIGGTYGTADKVFTLNVPIGVGLKWKIRDRMNVGLDWTFHFTPSDRLDGLEAPHGIKSSEFRNKDHYCQTLLTFTYDLSPKCAACNKD